MRVRRRALLPPGGWGVSKGARGAPGHSAPTLLLQDSSWLVTRISSAEGGFSVNAPGPPRDTFFRALLTCVSCRWLRDPDSV